jgi:hypothetical protein
VSKTKFPLSIQTVTVLGWELETQGSVNDPCLHNEGLWVRVLWVACPFLQSDPDEQWSLAPTGKTHHTCPSSWPEIIFLFLTFHQPHADHRAFSFTRKLHVLKCHCFSIFPYLEWFGGNWIKGENEWEIQEVERIEMKGQLRVRVTVMVWTAQKVLPQNW